MSRHRRNRAHAAAAANSDVPQSGMALAMFAQDGSLTSVAPLDAGKYQHFSAVVTDANPLWAAYRPGTGGRINATVTSLKNMSTPLREMLMPHQSDRQGIIDRIFAAARDVAIVRQWVERLAEFASAGFDITCENETQQEFLQQLTTMLDWEAIDYRLHQNLALTQQVVIWWSYYRDGEKRAPDAPLKGTYVPKWVEQIPPSVLAYTSLGKLALKACELQPLASIAKKKPETRSDEENLYLLQFPLDLVQAAAKTGNQAIYPLDRLMQGPNAARMGYTVLNHWGKQDWEKWSVPDLYTVLADLEYLLLCQDIDYAAVHRMRAGILLWKMGPKEPKPDNPGPPEPVLKAAEDRISDALKSLCPDIFVGRDFEVEWIIAPTELFSPEKYAGALQRVMDLLGIPDIFYPVGHVTKKGGSQAYASSYNSLKPFQQSIMTRRRMIRNPTQKWMWLICFINQIGMNAEDKNSRPSPVTVRYDENVLTEDSVIIQKVTLALDKALISNETAADILRFNYPAEVLRRRREIEQMGKTDKEAKDQMFQPYVQAKPAGFGDTGKAAGGGRPHTQQSPVDPDDASQPKPAVDPRHE